MGKRLAQMLVYAAFGSVFAPLVSAMLLLPSLLIACVVAVMPSWQALTLAVPMVLVSVPII